ncbi:hypothetical protein DE146DRAFT_643101 [Phaeosphaeria sp. MPI-PUGE-AT-0046c]|nr:hypothetical protein DE146DRAFT_643101 [Phaeosphaeria sp. MPI-PUGE-AT-0046c]
MPSYTPWTWSPPHERHYSYLLADDGRTILETRWEGPSAAGAAPAQPILSAGTSATTVRAQAAQDEDEDEEGEEEEEEEEEEESDDEAAGPAHVTTSLAYNQDAVPGTQKGKSRRQDSIYNTKALESLHIRPSYTAGQRQGIPLTSAHSTASSSRNSMQTYASQSNYNTGYGEQRSTIQPGRSNATSLSPDIQAQLKDLENKYKRADPSTVRELRLERRFIRTDPSTNNEAVLDARYRRVTLAHHGSFFVPGRVFRMLWSEPAGQANPGQTRNSTHFSTVWLGEQAYSVIRRFVVVRNKGTFSQCIPIQTYSNLGAAKAGLIMVDHGIIHTSPNPPNQLPGEALVKYSIRVQPTNDENLHPASRVNYGRPYAVEHNVKVLDVGMVVEQHRYLLSAYFYAAMWGGDEPLHGAILTSAAAMGASTSGTTIRKKAPASPMLSASEISDSATTADGSISRLGRKIELSESLVPSADAVPTSTASDPAARSGVAFTSLAGNAMGTLKDNTSNVPRSLETDEVSSAKYSILEAATGSKDSDSGSSLADTNVPLDQLFHMVTRNFDDAIANEHGWAWRKDALIARKLLSLSCRYNNWHASICWLMSNSTPSPTVVPVVDDLEHLFGLLTQERPLLSYLINSYMSEIAQNLEDIKACNPEEPQGVQYVLMISVALCVS